MTASLKSLFDKLTLTNDARSLRDRLVEARTQYSPLAQRVAAGDTIAYEDYSDIARTMLDLQRQIWHRLFQVAGRGDGAHQDAYRFRNQHCLHCGGKGKPVRH